MSNQFAINAHQAAIWLQAARPRTLPAAVVPVMVGLALAWRAGHVDALVGTATMAAAVLIQIGTNLANDYYDYVAGADTVARLGPVRVTQAGLVEPATVRSAAYAVLALAALIGTYLVRIGGWPILLIGVFSLIAAIAYSTGPWPLAYNGAGDVFVFVFFGLLAVNGTFFLQTGRISALSMLSSLPVAFLVTAILVVNNLRDIPTDTAAGKRTLAVRFGRCFARFEYYTLVVAAFLMIAPLAMAGGWRVLIVTAAVPLAIHESRAVASRSGAALNSSLAGTARLHMVYGLLLSVALLR